MSDMADKAKDAARDAVEKGDDVAGSAKEHLENVPEGAKDAAEKAVEGGDSLIDKAKDLLGGKD